MTRFRDIRVVALFPRRAVMIVEVERMYEIGWRLDIAASIVADFVTMIWPHPHIPHEWKLETPADK